MPCPTLTQACLFVRWRLLLPAVHHCKLNLAQRSTQFQMDTTASGSKPIQSALSQKITSVFALDTPSTYYDKSSRDDVLHAFISKLGGTCSIGKTWEMEDPHRAMTMTWC